MLKLSFLAALYLLTTSCLENKKDEGPDMSPRNNGDASLLMGDWGSGCLTDDNFVRKVDYSFTTSYMEFIQTDYDDSDIHCTTPTLRERYRFNYMAGNGLLEIKDIITAFITSYKPSEIDWYNQSNYCDSAPWVLGEEKEVNVDQCGIDMGMAFSNGEFEVTSSTLKLREYGTAPSVNDPVFTKK